MDQKGFDRVANCLDEERLEIFETFVFECAALRAERDALRDAAQDVIAAISKGPIRLRMQVMDWLGSDDEQFITAVIKLSAALDASDTDGR